MSKKKLQASIFTVLLLLIAGQVFHNTKVAAITEEITLLEITESELQEKLATIKPYIGKENTVGEGIHREISKLEKLNELIPTDNDTAPHVDYLYEIARKHKVKGHTATFIVNNADTETLPQLDIDVAFEGKQNDLIKVVEELQSFKEKPYTITDFSLNPIGEGEYVLKVKIKSIFHKNEL